MHQIYGSTVNYIIAFAILKFHYDFQDKKANKSVIYLIPIAYTLYRILTTEMLIEPFRMLLSPVFLSAMLLVFKEKISWIFLMISFLISQALWMLALLASSITAVILYTTLELWWDETILLLIALGWNGVVYTIFFSLEKHKKINLSAFGEMLVSPTIRKMVWTIGVLIVVLYSFIQISGNLPIASDFMSSLVIIGLSAIVVLTIVILSVLLIRHLTNEKKWRDDKEKQRESLETQNKWLENENERISKEYTKIQNQMAELNQVYETLKRDFGEVSSNHHNYRYIVPVLINMQQKLVEEMNSFTEYSFDEKTDWIRDYTDEIKSLLVDVREEMVDDAIKATIAGLDLPEKWNQLAALLEKLLNVAQQEKGVYLSIYNYAKTWNDFEISNSIFIRLFSNIVDNAVKESSKLPEDARTEVKIIFNEDEDGCFMFEVQDGANEFNIPILKNLGMRKNSTNGTGDGYAEIMKDLSDTQATFVLKEWKRDEKFGKQISVIFDGYGAKIIDSNYRADILKQTLDSDFEVIGY